MRRNGKWSALPRWAAIAALMAAVAILLVWWVGRDPQRPGPVVVEGGPAIEGDRSDGPEPADRIEAAPAARRVEVFPSDCPGEVPSSPNLHVRVVDQVGRPVARARVVRWDPHGWRALESTNAGGILEATIPECSGQSLAVHAEGFATAHRDLGARFPVDLVVTMNPERSLRGRVVDTSGAPLPGMTVVAWPSHRRPSGRDVAESVTARAIFSQSTTDDAGRFTVRGLDPGTTHTLIAGGGGYVLVDPVAVAPSTDEGIELRLWRLHGIRLRVRAAGGGRPVLSQDVGTTGCTSFRQASHFTYRDIHPASAQAALSPPVRDHVLEGRGYSLYDDLLLYASPDAPDRLGPIHYRFCVPGYAPAEGELWVPPVEGTDIAEAILPLEQVVPVFGPLEVRVHGVPAQDAPLHTAREPYLVVFARNTEVDCEYLFRAPESDSLTLDGLLPTGRTEFVLGDTEWQMPDWSKERITLDLTDQRNVLDLDLSEFGGVEFDLYDSMGRSVRGAIRVALVDGEGYLVRRLAFRSAPYRAFGLTRGEYALTVQQSYSRREDSAHSEIFRVEPGRFVRVKCVPGEGEYK